MKLPQLPSTIRFREEGNGSVLLTNLRAGKLYSVQDSSQLSVLERLASSSASIAELEQITEGSDTSAKRRLKSFLLDLYEGVVSNGWPSREEADRLPRVHAVSAPVYLEVILTYKCNMRCRHCLVGSFRDRPSAEMPEKTALTVMERASDADVMKIILTGGEPTTHPRFWQILARAADRGLGIALATNGVNLSPDAVARMSKQGVFKFMLSLEGGRAETHDYIRGEGNFDRVLQAIRNIHQHAGATVELTVTYSKRNMPEIREMIELAAELGVDMLKFSRLKPWGWGRELESICPTEEEIASVNRLVEGLKPDFPGFQSLGADATRPPKEFTCDVHYGLAVMPSGHIIPCSSFEQDAQGEAVLGHVSTDSLRGVWESPRAHSLRERMAGHGMVMSSRCETAGCARTRVCPSLYCLAEAQYAFGSIDPSAMVPAKCATRLALETRPADEL